MKRTNRILLLALSLLLSGCVVTSIYPFFTEKDLVFEPALLGNWGKITQPDEHWTFERHGENAYRVSIREQDKVQSGEARLFRLEGQLFLDFFAPELKEQHQPEPAPTHILVRVTRLSPTLKLASLDYDWLKKLLADNPQALRHVLIKSSTNETEGRLVLTADTQELRAFLTKHLSEKEAWHDDPELKHE